MNRGTRLLNRATRARVRPRNLRLRTPATKLRMPERQDQQAKHEIQGRHDHHQHRVRRIGGLAGGAGPHEGEHHRPHKGVEDPHDRDERPVDDHQDRHHLHLIDHDRSPRPVVVRRVLGRQGAHSDCGIINHHERVVDHRVPHERGERATAPGLARSAGSEDQEPSFLRFLILSSCLPNDRIVFESVNLSEEPPSMVFTASRSTL